MGEQGGLWDWYLSHSEFLYDVILKKGWFYIDHWSLVHSWTGAVVITLLASLRFRHRWCWLFFFLTAYELLEVAFVYIALHIFRPERLNDQVMDLLVGTGAAIVWNQLVVNRDGRPFRLLLMAFSSATVAFPVTGMLIQRLPGGAAQMDWPLLGLLILSGTLYLLVSQALTFRHFSRTATLALPAIALALLLWILIPVNLPVRIALAFLIPLGISGFYLWFSRQTDRARLFLGTVPLTEH